MPVNSYNLAMCVTARGLTLSVNYRNHSLGLISLFTHCTCPGTQPTLEIAVWKYDIITLNIR